MSCPHLAKPFRDLRKAEGMLLGCVCHGVALLRGFVTPSLAAQGRQRLPSYFNIQRGNPVSRWCQPQNQTELFTARKRLQKSDYFGSIVGRCESSIRLHVVARHHFIRACDEAI